MNRFAYAQDILKNSAGSIGAGFNRRIGGQSFADAFQHESERLDQAMVAGFYKADELIEAGEIFYVHNFHKLECPNGHAFLYGGTYACNTCRRDHLDKEWWKVKVMRDGNAWCCIGNGFIDLQQSDNYAFGDTREQAIQAYGELMLAKERTPASPVQGAASASDVCAEMRAMCSNCGGTGDVTRADGEWLGRCTCPYGASGAKGVAVKPWQERMDEYEERFGKSTSRPAIVYAEEEIADWRALADRSPAVQPSGAVAEILRVLLANVGWDDCTDDQLRAYVAQDSLLALAILKARALLATPAPEQEAAPKNGEDGYLCPAGKAQAAVREAVQVAPPGAQEVVYSYECRQPHTDPVIWCEFFSRDKPKADSWIRNVQALYGEPAAQDDVARACGLLEAAAWVSRCQSQLIDKTYVATGLHALARAKITAPVPATTPAEQPEGDSSHVVPPFAAPAGQHGACTVCNGVNSLLCGRCDGMGLEPRKLVGYGDCRCVLSQYCDGTCNPIWADEVASGSREGREACPDAGSEGHISCATATNTNQPENLGAANTNKGGEEK